MVPKRLLLLAIVSLFVFSVPADAFAASITVYVKITQTTAPVSDTQVNVFIYDTANPTTAIGTGTAYVGNSPPPAEGYRVNVTGIDDRNFVAGRNYYAVAEVGRSVTVPNNRYFKGQSTNFTNTTTRVEVSTRADRGTMTPLSAGDWALAIGLLLAVLSIGLLIWRNRRMRAPAVQPA